jgi:hypothetical protein
MHGNVQMEAKLLLYIEKAMKNGKQESDSRDSAENRAGIFKENTFRKFIITPV